MKIFKGIYSQEYVTASGRLAPSKLREGVSGMEGIAAASKERWLRNDRFSQ